MDIVNLIVQAIAAVGSALAAFAAWEALKVARQANALAEKTAAESADHIRESNRLALEAAEQAELHAREAEKREEMRDQRRIASNMQAWWVINETKKDSPRWGIILSNTGADTAVFYNVDIQLKSKSGPLSVNIETLPPGQYFLESNKTKDGYRMSYPESIRELRGCQPLLRATTHIVEAMEFTDQVGQRWQWTRKTGLSAI